MTQNPINNLDVMLIFDRYPPQIHQSLMALRELIFDTAQEIEGVGQLEETLKWGQPSYLTAESRSGTTIRIDQVKNQATQYALYLNCQTTLIETFRELYPEFTYEGNRAILFDIDSNPSSETLKDCISMALTYHKRKKNAK